jgi:type III pantothenate kinase
VILAVNVGNSALGVGLVQSGRTSKPRSVARSGGVGALRSACVHLVSGEEAGIDGVCLCSVVPDLTASVTDVCREFARDVVVVDHCTETGLTLTYANPEELGADRLVNAYAGWRLHGPAAVVVDLGTATTVDLVGADGTHYGGAISVGMGSAARALHELTARLPLVEPGEPLRAVGTSTADAIQSGVFWGTVGLVDELVQRLTSEVGLSGTVVATGGWSELVGPRCRTVDAVDRWLTLKGLGLLWERLRCSSEMTSDK